MPRTSTLMGRLAAACALAVLAACSQPSADKGEASAGGGDRVFVSDERGDSITVIDPVTGTVVATLKPGKRPRGMAISPDGTKLYVALSGSAIAGPGVDEDALPEPDRSQDGIGVINLADLSIGKLLKAGNDPEAFAISPDGQNLFVSNEDTSETSILNLNSGQIRARIKVGPEPEGAAISPDGKTLLVASEADNSIYVIDVASSRVLGTIQAGGRPRALVFTDDGLTAYASNENSGAVTLLDVPGRKVKTSISIPDVGAGTEATPATKGGAASPTAPKPMGLVFSPDKTKLYSANGRGRSVAEIDVATNTVTRMFKDVGDRPWGITISKDGKTLFTANGPSNDVSMIDIAAGTVTKRIPSGASPWGIVYLARD